MQFKIILLTMICATFQIVKMSGHKRIKRQFNLMPHDKRLKHDFVMLPNQQQDQLHSLHYEPFSTSALDSNNSETLISNTNTKRNSSKPLIEMLRKAEHPTLENRKEDVLSEKRLTADAKAKAFKENEEKSLTVPDRHCNIKGFVEEHVRHHKAKHMPHSREVFEAKIIMPSHHMKPVLQDLESFGSRTPNNVIMYRVGIDSLPAHFFYPKMLLTQNSPILYDAEPLNEPSFDYFFNSFSGAPKDHSLYRQAFRQTNSAIIDNSWPNHEAFNAPPASVREPTQLASLMQNALDALLATNSEDIEGDKSAPQIEFSCPLHPERETAQMAGDKANVIQVCSCRLIKKTKDDGVKKSK